MEKGRIVISHGFRYFGDGFFSIGEQAAAGVDPRVLQEVGKSDASLTMELPAQISCAVTLVFEGVLTASI